MCVLTTGEENDLAIKINSRAQGALAADQSTVLVLLLLIYCLLFCHLFVVVLERWCLLLVLFCGA